MQIQLQESLKYDQLFINLGPFLIKLSFFKTLGKIVGESGGTYVLQEAEILAKGSIKYFLEERNYWRWKAFYGVLGITLEFMLYGQCLNTVDRNNESIATTYQEIKNFKDGFKVYSKDMGDIFSGFLGKLGKTAHIWQVT